MLIYSNWTLTPIEPILLPRSYSLELVKILHEKFNLEMGKETIPSVTFSGLIGKCDRLDNFLSFNPENNYKLFLTGLNIHASKSILGYEFPEILEFLGAKFKLIEQENIITSYEELYTQLITDEPELTQEFNLAFLSPTSFAQAGNYLPLPVPTLMFRSWLERWNHFAPVYLGSDELITYLSNNVKIKKHLLQTRNFQLQRGYLTGFIGNVSLQFSRGIEPLLLNVANLLVNYANFAGTGVKTRLGMGHTQLIV